jgi:hypothetical protein
VNNIMNNPDYRAELQDLYTSIQLYTGLNPAAADVHPAELTDDKLMDIACATDLVYYMGEGYGFASRYQEEADITAEVLAFARAAIAADRARWGTPAIEPVPVSERPWEREGWCDAEGQCWMGHPGGAGFIPSWRLCRPEDAPSMTCSLPHNDLPTPEATNA